MHSPIAATALLEPIPRSPIHPKAAARFAAAVRALFRFPTRTVRKPQEVVILVTIMACLMVETDDRQCARHIRDHRNRENGKAEPRDELASSHSITSSASASSLSGIWRPSALAVLRLMASSNAVG